VRKDGFFRVAQDLRQEGMNNFPASYLDESSEVSEYSSYVTSAVSQYESDVGAGNLYEMNPPLLTEAANMPAPLVFPASTFGTASVMQAGGITLQQLRSRGIYIDYMSDDLRIKINCMDLGGDGDTCGVPSVTTALEIIPFYDVQLTWLARWNETPNNNPVDVTNETIKNGNAHSRGKASLELGFGFSTDSAAAHKGNLGLTATDPIDPHYITEEKIQYLYTLASDPNSPPPLSTIVISGTITSGVGGVKAADVEISASGAQCDRTNTGYECVLIIGANNPRLMVTNYDKNNKIILACSTVLTLHDQSANSWTRFDLPNIVTPDADIVIAQDVCP